MLSSCTSIQHLSRMIYFLIHNATQVQTPGGKFRLLNGLLFFIALEKANRLEKSQGIMACPMRLYGVFYAPHKGKQANVFTLPRQSQLTPRVEDVAHAFQGSEWIWLLPGVLLPQAHHRAEAWARPAPVP